MSPIPQTLKFAMQQHMTEDTLKKINDLTLSLAKNFYARSELACVIEKVVIEEIAQDQLGRLLTAEELERLSRWFELDITTHITERIRDALSFCNIDSYQQA